MKILALIPARGGSKRLPGKNIKLLGDQPLIAWTIRAALDSGVCTDVLVSTDDPAIAKVALDYGASVPWIRPAELATDTASSVDVALHAIDRYENENGPIDGLLLLQATSPFRTFDSIRRAVMLYGEGAAQHPVVSVSPASVHPVWCFRRVGDGIEPFLGWENVECRSQDLEPAFMLNGSIYLICPSRLRKERTFLTTDTQPLVLTEEHESIDIDSALDWEKAEVALRTQKLST